MPTVGRRELIELLGAAAGLSVFAGCMVKPVSPVTHLRTSSPASTTSAPSWLRQRWNAATGVVGVLVGLAPHVLHHVGALAGTALVAGSGGTALFGALGLIPPAHPAAHRATAPRSA